MQSRNKLPARASEETRRIYRYYIEQRRRQLFNVVVIFSFLFFSLQKHSQRATGLADSAEFISPIYKSIYNNNIYRVRGGGVSTLDGQISIMYIGT